MLEDQLKQKAHDLGFALAGVARATPADGFDRLQEWLERGYAGEMNYLERQREARHHPRSIFPEVRSVIMVGMIYEDAAVSVDAGPGRIARYAQGPDYHEVLWAKLDELLAWLRTRTPGCNGRGVVDSAPLLERDFARRAGLGWFGKNTMLISKSHGSYLFLGALLVDIELQADAPHVSSHCGTCTACLQACPTDAFAGPGWLDARRCISYLTIELRGAIPTELRPQMGNWLFGCDVCQEVCPWNRKPHEPAFPHRADLETLDPAAILALGEGEFRERFRHTALWRARRSGLRRNAAIVLGNTGDAGALEVLENAAADADLVVREAAAWAIGRIRDRLAASVQSTGRPPSQI